MASALAAASLVACHGDAPTPVDASRGRDAESVIAEPALPPPPALPVSGNPEDDPDYHGPVDGGRDAATPDAVGDAGSSDASSSDASSGDASSGPGDAAADAEAHLPDAAPADAHTPDASCTSASTLERVDVLFMVDNSGSMSEEQAKLVAKLTRLVSALTSGDEEAGKASPRSDEYPGRRFTPPRSLHFGVVTSDLGAPPDVVSIASTSCLGAGGNGELVASGVAASTDQISPNTQLLVRPGRPECGSVALTPPYIGFGASERYPDTHDASALGRALSEFGCIASAGIQGCGIEQPLEAAYKALAPATVNDFVGADALGHGARNGFLRADSVLATVLVSDEDDCSVSAQGARMFERDGTPAVNVRCPLEGELSPPSNALRPVERYVDGLLALRPGHPERLIFAGLVGLPQADVDYTKFDALLAHPRMQVVLNPNGTDITSVCGSAEAGSNALAYPGRRFVKAAKGLATAGGGVVLRSICDDDYAAVIDALVERIAGQLTGC